MEHIFEPQSNCWQVRKARHAALLIDGERYFRALHQAMSQARQSIIIVGWDLHSGLQLIRNGTASDYPRTLGKLLDHLAGIRPRLNIYLLSWDFAMIYAMEREFFPRYNLRWQRHKRIHFCLDGEHPVGGSQHQKVVVIDDALAFSGGLDLSKWRWDTSEHRPDDKLRVDPDGRPYPPFHDVQIMVDGEAAAALGDLVRQRWQRACGEMPSRVDAGRVDNLWPEAVQPDFEDISVAIARTQPQYKEYAEVREVEKLYQDSIARARRWIYIENQYLSSYCIGEALKARLIEDAGPEIVMVLPKETGGWLEQYTMDVLRSRILHELRAADRHDRLRVYYPRLSVEPDVELMVHAKVMVIDDGLVRIGSSNLSNRSLGLDSECDLAVAGADGSVVSQTISSFRNRLLAEHLGQEEKEVAAAITETSSLIAAIETLQGGARTLMPLDGKVDEMIDQLVPESALLDPEKPIEPEEFLDYLIRPELQRPAYRHLLKVIITVVAVLAMAALWLWTPLGSTLDIETVTKAAGWLKGHPYSPVMVPLSFVLLGLVSFPVTLLIMATIIVYGPLWGSWYALVGVSLSAVAMFSIGHMLGRTVVSALCGSLINRVNQRLSEVGLVAVIVFRIIPVAPFSLINLVAGVSAISLKDFVLGTLIGVLPGIVAISLVSDLLSSSLRQPDLLRFAGLCLVVAACGAALIGLRYWIRERYVRKRQHKGS